LAAATGAFCRRLAAPEELDQRLDLLNCHHGRVVRSLSETLLRIDDGELQRDLKDMIEIHERNIERSAVSAPLVMDAAGCRKPFCASCIQRI
jgi:hypothetical protein